jgi:hypothetical protein
MMVGELGLPDEGGPAISSRELRAVPDLNLLIVLNLRCDPQLHGCAASGGEVENLKFYDITDRLHPALLSTYPVTGTSTFRPRSPHEFFLWRDGARVLVFLTAPPASPSLEVIDASDPRAPVRIAAWDTADAGLVPGGPDDILHSVGVSADGKVAYLSHQQGGLLLADVSQLPAVSLITPIAAALDFSPPASIGPHSAVQVPGRDVLLVTEEVYPMPFGTGCPWGHLRTVGIGNPAAPAILGEVGVPENDPRTCATPHDKVAFTAHNATATHDLALVTWYAGGLQAIDISNPAAPVSLGELRPEPLPAVTTEDPALGGALVEMWSYPVIRNGLIYVVDVRNGLYILRYAGLWAAEIEAETFREGNSNL